MVGLSKKRVFPKTKGDSITGQDRAQKHCDFRFSQIEKNLKSQFCNYFQQRDSRSYNRDSTHRFAFSEIAVREEAIINANSTDKSPQTSTKSLYRKGPGSRCIGLINLALSRSGESRKHAIVNYRSNAL